MDQERLGRDDKSVGLRRGIELDLQEESLVRGCKRAPIFVGCDAGTTDSGPYYLGSEIRVGPREGPKRNLRIMIREDCEPASPSL